MSSLRQIESSYWFDSVSWLITIFMLVLFAVGGMVIINHAASIDNDTDCSVEQNPMLCVITWEVIWKGLQVLPFTALGFGILCIFEVFLKPNKREPKTDIDRKLLAIQNNLPPKIWRYVELAFNITSIIIIVPTTIGILLLPDIWLSGDGDRETLDIVMYMSVVIIPLFVVFTAIRWIGMIERRSENK